METVKSIVFLQRLQGQDDCLEMHRKKYSGDGTCSAHLPSAYSLYGICSVSPRMHGSYLWRVSVSSFDIFAYAECKSLIGQMGW